jgi:hypothetical protein
MSDADFPPPGATREQVLAWRNERAQEHNAAVEQIRANHRAARGLWAKLDPATKRVIEAADRRARRRP